MARLAESTNEAPQASMPEAAGSMADRQTTLHHMSPPKNLAFHLLRALQQHDQPLPYLASIQAFLDFVAVSWDCVESQCSDDEARARLNPVLSRLYELDPEEYVQRQEERSAPDWGSIRNSFIRNLVGETLLHSRAQNQAASLTSSVNTGDNVASPRSSPSRSTSKSSRYSSMSTSSTRSGRKSSFNNSTNRSSLTSMSSIDEDQEDPEHEDNPGGDTDSATAPQTVRSSTTGSRRTAPLRAKKPLVCPHCRKDYDVPGHFQNHLERYHLDYRPLEVVLNQPITRIGSVHPGHGLNQGTPRSDISTPPSSASPFDAASIAAPEREVTYDASDSRLRPHAPLRAADLASHYNKGGVQMMAYDPNTFPSHPSFPNSGYAQLIPHDFEMGGMGHHPQQSIPLRSDSRAYSNASLSGRPVRDSLVLSSNAMQAGRMQ